eukprot:2710368-Rhodomonas_salina.1
MSEDGRRWRDEDRIEPERGLAETGSKERRREGVLGETRKLGGEEGRGLGRDEEVRRGGGERLAGDVTCAVTCGVVADRLGALLWGCCLVDQTLGARGRRGLQPVREGDEGEEGA